MVAGFFPNHSLLRLSQVSKFAVDPLAQTLPDELLGTLLIEETFNPLGPAIRPGDVDDPADAICALLGVKRGGVFHLSHALSWLMAPLSALSNLLTVRATILI
jgi:hypothetical protein